MPSRNPQRSSSRAVDESTQKLGLDIGVVTSTSRGEAYEVEVSLFGDNEVADVSAQLPGDFAIPPEDTRVVIARQRDEAPIVVSVLPSDETTPDVSIRTRRFSHAYSDAYIEFSDDGNVVVRADDGTTATLSGGSWTVTQ